MRAVAGDWRHMEHEAVRAAVSDVKIPWRAERRQKRGVAFGGESEDSLRTTDTSASNLTL